MSYSRWTPVIPRSMLHDEQYYPNPTEFRPERFLLPDGTPNPDAKDPGAFAFGFGRRICPGRFLSDTSLYSVITSVLAVYDILPALDANGKEEKVTPAWTTGLVQYPAAVQLQDRAPLEDGGGADCAFGRSLCVRWLAGVEIQCIRFACVPSSRAYIAPENGTVFASHEYFVGYLVPTHGLWVQFKNVQPIRPRLFNSLPQQNNNTRRTRAPILLPH